MKNEDTEVCVAHKNEGTRHDTTRLSHYQPPSAVTYEWRQTQDGGPCHGHQLTRFNLAAQVGKKKKNWKKKIPVARYANFQAYVVDNNVEKLSLIYQIIF